MKRKCNKRDNIKDRRERSLIKSYTEVRKDKKLGEIFERRNDRDGNAKSCGGKLLIWTEKAFKDFRKKG